MDKEKLHLAVPGCVYHLLDRKLVYQLIDTGNFNLIKTYFSNENKKWWQFWKIKKPVGYEVMCIRDLEIPKKEIYEVNSDNISI